MSTDKPARADTPPAPAATAPPSRWERVPGPVFLALLGATGLGGWLAWTRVEGGAFLLVVGAWLVSLTLHEYAHARLARALGDPGPQERGYSNLNPLRFRARFLTVVLPTAYLLMGGFGMTGPLIHPSGPQPAGRLRRSLIAAAGPAVNLLLAAVLMMTVVALLGGQRTDSWFWSALVFLAFIQATAGLISLLPVPGLDGYGIVAPFLPPRAARLARRGVTAGPILVFALVWFPPVHSALFDTAQWAVITLGLNPLLFLLGQEVFTVWSP